MAHVLQGLTELDPGMHCAHMGVLFLMETAYFVCAIRGRARGTHYGLGTLDPRQSRPHGRNRSPSPCSQKFFKGCGWVGSFSGSAHPLSPNGRMCALHSPLPPFPTNPLSQHRNALCAHGCVVFDGDCVFCLRNTGARAGPTTVWALWTQDNHGLMAAIVPRPCAVCINPSSQWTQRSFGFHVFHWCVSCTSWCLQSHDPGLMTHLVVPLCVPGRPRLHGQGQLSQHRGCPK